MEEYKKNGFQSNQVYKFNQLLRYELSLVGEGGLIRLSDQSEKPGMVKR